MVYGFKFICHAHSVKKMTLEILYFDPFPDLHIPYLSFKKEKSILVEYEALLRYKRLKG